MKVVTARAKEYAPPKVNFERTRKLWSAYLGKELTLDDVAALNILQKISRLMHKYQPDSVEDIKGYAECWRIINE